MYKNLHDTLNSWYRDNGRHHLPWRHIDDAYKIWVSEIMLQQTQVKTVLERFYFPFLERFPTLQELAEAGEDDVLKQWEGLGYYTRARNLHATAQRCKTSLPHSVHELVQLPGIGQSTAHAIASFAYKTPVPILDANVKRILYRFFAIKECKEKELWEKAYELFDEQRPYDYNQSLMDLGSTVCMHKQPLCDICPLASGCQGKLSPLHFPTKKGKKKTPVRHKHIVIHTHNEKYALKQRQSRFLNGLWGFSEYEIEEDIQISQTLGEITQVYSHFKLQATVHLRHEYISEHEWFSLDEIRELALSKADHKALALLMD